MLEDLQQLPYIEGNERHVHAGREVGLHGHEGEPSRAHSETLGQLALAFQPTLVLLLGAKALCPAQGLISTYDMRAGHSKTACSAYPASRTPGMRGTLPIGCVQP